MSCSLLAFDPEYLGALIDLGETDAAAHGEAIRTLLTPPVPREPSGNPE